MDILIYIGFTTATINLIVVTMIIALYSRKRSLSGKASSVLLDIAILLTIFGLTCDIVLQDVWSKYVTISFYVVATFIYLIVILYLPKGILENGKNH